MTKLESIIDRMVTQLLTVDAGATYTNTIQRVNDTPRNPLQEATSEYPLCVVRCEHIPSVEHTDIYSEEWTAGLVIEGWVAVPVDDEPHEKLSSLLEDVVHLVKTDRTWNANAYWTEIGAPTRDERDGLGMFSLPLKVTWFETVRA